jgi:hypothetical protein
MGDVPRQPTSHERRAGRPWDASYLDGPAPWDLGRPQPAIVRLADDGAFSGTVLDAEFADCDALHLDRLGRAFETVLDCGLFHSFDSGERRDYVASLASVIRPGGTLHLLCFSDAEGEARGPHPVSREELRAAFRGWRIVSIRAERIETMFDAQGSPAWLAELERGAGPTPRPEPPGR